MVEVGAAGSTPRALQTGGRRPLQRGERVPTRTDHYTPSLPFITYNPLLYPLAETQRLASKIFFGALSAGLEIQQSLLGLAQGCKLVPEQYAAFCNDILGATREMSDRAARDYTKPAWGLNETQIAGKTVAVYEVVEQDMPFGNLLHFKRDTNRNDPKLLLVAPMSGHYATLLRDTVVSLLPNHDVYVTDWKNAREIPLSAGDFGLDDYIDYVKGFIDKIGPGAHVMAVCQPTVATLAAVAELARDGSPNQPLSMTLLGGPLDVRAAATQVTDLAKEHSIDWFERNVIAQVPFGFAGAGRNVYPGFVQLTSFMAMNPSKHVGSHLDMFKHLALGNNDKADKLKAFYDEYLAVCDLPSRFYLDTVQKVFIDPELAQGTLMHRGHRVDPSAIKGTALFTVEGEKDDISAPGQTTAAHRMCAGLSEDQKFHYLQPDAGHYGIFSGSSWRAFIAPRITGFIRDAAARHGISHDDADGAIAPAPLA